MLRFPIGLLSAVLLLQALPARAAPITFDRSEAVADARRDPGTGICGSVIKYANQPTPLIEISEAIGLLNKPNGDANVAGRISRLFQNMNFSVGTGSGADFPAPMYTDDSFPYCQDPNAMPMGTDDNNIAMRLRGYINVTSAAAGQWVTFVMKADDAGQLWMGKSKVVVLQVNDDSPTLTGRRARWVTFKDPGLYPVEVVYFQGSTSGYLEWSRASISVFAGDDVSVDNVQWSSHMANFKPIAGVDLYSSIVGSNPACTECGAPGMDCTTGNYCGDGLCQPCNLPDHCGASCQKCPADRNRCSSGKCVQCTADSSCPPGGSCDIANGTCLPPVPCATNGECSSPQICRPDGFCGNPPTPCSADSQCLIGEICAPGARICCAPDKCGDFVPVPRLVATGCTLSLGPKKAESGRNSEFLALIGLSALLTLFIVRKASKGAPGDE